jgi:hypothetical protein
VKNSKNENIQTHNIRNSLFGCENWSFTLMVSEYRKLRRIFGPKREEVTGG